MDEFSECTHEALVDTPLLFIEPGLKFNISSGILKSKPYSIKQIHTEELDHSSLKSSQLCSQTVQNFEKKHENYKILKDGVYLKSTLNTPKNDANILKVKQNTKVINQLRKAKKNNKLSVVFEEPQFLENSPQILNFEHKKNDSFDYDNALD